MKWLERARVAFRDWLNKPTAEERAETEALIQAALEGQCLETDETSGRRLFSVCCSPASGWDSGIRAPGFEQAPEKVSSGWSDL